MIRHESDVVIRYIRTKNKTRKLATYRADDCELRIQHEKINRFLNERFIPSIFTKGYTKGRSIYHNAYAHMYNDYFIMMDIKDFFPHICHKQLAEKIYYEINLAEPNQISLLECKRIVDLCSISERGLPLGFITSPILSNIYLKEFDGIFYGQLKRLGLNNLIYTRYFVDVMMPELYGTELVPLMREKCGDHTLFVLMSSQHGYMKDGYSVEAFDFLCKPFSEKDVSAVISRAIKRFQACKQPRI